MYVEMQDVYNVMTLYFPLMCKTMVGYPVFGDDIMSVIHEYISSVLSNSQATMSPSPDDSIDEQNKSMLNPEKKTVKHVYFTADDIYENLRKREGYSAVSIDTVQKILEELFKCKCLDKGKNDYRSKNPKYALVETLPFLDAKYDWQAGFEDAYVKMREDNPKLAETWRSKQIKEGFVVVYHPISGQEQRLFSINS
jgi:hypothetical protein